VTFEVRAAAIGDAPALADLESRARGHLADQRGGPQALAEQPAVDDWAELLQRDDVRVFVATIDGVPLGYLELHLPDADGRALVNQVYVEEGARELGFGDDMIGLAIEATTRAGGTVIESFALPGDRNTKNLFERAGMTARKLIVAKRLA
jgi:ribosomal protein S18 acetylase RimI-like enzyme